MGTLTTSWEVQGLDLIKVVQTLESAFITWLYREHRLEDKTYTLFTDANEAFHREPDYLPLLGYVTGKPIRIIMHLRRQVVEKSGAVESGEVSYFLNSYTGVVNVQLSLSAGSVEHLRAAVDQARSRLTSQIGARVRAEVSRKTTFQDSKVSRTADGAGESLFDSHDQAARLTGQRLTRVFVSYSHDSQSHKDWVAKLVGRLNSLGVWLIFDQWDLELGGDIARFMEEGIGESDRVLVICTQEYNEKANRGVGGAGYEKMIMTGDLIKDQDTTRLIPVVRGSEDPLVPRFLSSRLFVDFRNDDVFDAGIDQLAEAILAPGSRRPSLGT